MSRSRRTRRSNGNRAYVVIVGIIVAFLLLGTVAGVIADRSASDNDGSTDDLDVIVTPGAEIARLQTQVASDPDDLDSLVVLAEILANSGRAPEAIPLFEDAVRRRPDDASLRLAFGRTLLRTNNVFDAEIQLRRATDLDPDDATAAFYLAQVFEAKGEAGLEDARRWYQKTIDLSPDSLIADEARDALDFLGTPVVGTATATD